MSKMNARSLLLGANVIALMLIFGFAFQRYALPVVTLQIYKADYKRMVFECDNVMREHFIAKAWVEKVPSESSARALRAAEVGLLTCHEYDVLRKGLIALGVSENQLSRVGLEAIEEKEKDVRSFVKTHEIRY